MNSGISVGDFSQVSASTGLLLSAAGCQTLTSIICVIAILKIQDPSLLSAWKKHPIIVFSIVTLTLADPSIFFILNSQLMHLDIFSTKFQSLSMNKLFKGVLISSLLVKLIDVSYSSLQLNFFQSHSHRLLANSANYPIDSSCTTELLIVSLFSILVLIYLLYSSRGT